MEVCYRLLACRDGSVCFESFVCKDEVACTLRVHAGMVVCFRSLACRDGSVFFESVRMRWRARFVCMQGWRYPVIH
jgi:hypothetical protein